MKPAIKRGLPFKKLMLMDATHRLMLYSDIGKSLGNYKYHATICRFTACIRLIITALSLPVILINSLDLTLIDPNPEFNLFGRVLSKIKCMHLSRDR